MRIFKQFLESVFIATLFLLLAGIGIFIARVINIPGDVMPKVSASVPGAENEMQEISSATSTPLSSPAIENIFPFAKIIKVIDGDTVTIQTDELSASSTYRTMTYKVRLIGINTPETVDPRKEVECFGKEASAEAKKVLSGKNVKLELDASQQRTDRYGRLLAYVYVENILFNQYMIENGFAYEYTYNLPYVYQKEFKMAQAIAKANNKGLWGQGGCAVI